MKNPKVFEFLNKNHIHWDSMDYGQMVVWTSGYKTMEHYDIMRKLQEFGLICMREEWDKICGKTKGVYWYE